MVKNNVYFHYRWEGKSHVQSLAIGKWQSWDWSTDLSDSEVHLHLVSSFYFLGKCKVSIYAELTRGTVNVKPSIAWLQSSLGSPIGCEQNSSEVPSTCGPIKSGLGQYISYNSDQKRSVVQGPSLLLLREWVCDSNHLRPCPLKSFPLLTVPSLIL